MRTKVIVQKHWLILITLLLGLSLSLIGCSKVTSSLSKQSTSTASEPSTSDMKSSTDKTIPSVQVTPNDTNKQSSTPSSKVSESSKTTSTKTSEKSSAIAISKATYNQLKYGDTYEKIKGLLGGTGEVVTESGTKGSKDYTVTYLYHVKSSSGGEVFLAFKDDKLVNKMEVNLR